MLPVPETSTCLCPFLPPGKKFALKIIEKAQFAVGDHSLENEISILCSVNHPNIVNLEEWFDESSKARARVIFSGRCTPERLLPPTPLHPIPSRLTQRASLVFLQPHIRSGGSRDGVRVWRRPL